MKKVSEHFGKAIWLPLLIVFPILQSTSMPMNATRVYVLNFLVMALFFLVVFLISFFPLFLQLLQSILGLENQRGNASADLCVHFVGGGLAGMTAASATYPLDLVRTRLAAQVISVICE